MIKILTKGGKEFSWDKKEYSFQYDKKAVLIFKDLEIVCIYNLDAMAMLIVE